MEYYLLTLSIIPLFVGRAALPIFATACFARWGNNLDVSWMGFFEDFSGVALLDNIPAWAIQTELLVVLGLLAAVEFGIRHIPEARLLLDGASDATIKGIGAGACSYLLVGGDLNGILDIWMKTGDLAHFQWGLGMQYTWSFGVGIAVCFLSWARMELYELLEQMDPEDDLGITGVLLWAEEAIGFLGVFFAFLLPGLTALTALVGVGLAGLLTMTLKMVERVGFEPCAGCDVEGPKCAPTCASCGHSHSHPHKVGMLGRVTDNEVTNPQRHRVDLIASRRCPSCGIRKGRGRDLSGPCRDCGTLAFSSPQELDAYIDTLSSRLGPTLLVCFLFSSIPLVGLLPGILYYRLTLISGFRAYMPTSSRFLRRWLLRMFKIGLLLVQWIPLVGALTVPLVCLADFLLARRSVAEQAQTLWPDGGGGGGSGDDHAGPGTAPGPNVGELPAPA